MSAKSYTELVVLFCSLIIIALASMAYLLAGALLACAVGILSAIHFVHRHRLAGLWPNHNQPSR